MLFVTIFTAGLAVAAGIPQLNTFEGFVDEGFICPKPYGLFMDPYQCDKYYECEDDIPRARLCEDGKVFDEFKGHAGHVDPCDSPYVVDCLDRPDLQAPTNRSRFCPRLHGIFADQVLCDKYYTCIDGHHTVTTCVAGLQFDEKTGTCAWPAVAKRTNCGKEKKCIGDFCCENARNMVNDMGQPIPHPAFPNLKDCQKFYVCLNGVTPQEASCSAGFVFDEVSMICDYPENVPECRGWYGDYYDEEPAAGNEAAPAPAKPKA